MTFPNRWFRAFVRERSRFGKIASLAAIAAPLLLLLAGPPARAQSDFEMLALQQEGQASLIIDDAAHAAYFIDLGKQRDGERLLFGDRKLLDYLVQRKIEHLVIACSHPHEDHMGGIRALFEKNPEQLFFDGDLTRPRFKTVTVIDDGVKKSLGDAYAAFAKTAAVRPDLEFQRLRVTVEGVSRNAFAELPFAQRDVRISNIPYVLPPETNRAGKIVAADHDRSVVTLIEFPGTGQRILDFDDASTKATRASVDYIVKVLKITEIDTFVVPHHGSRKHDIAAVFDLKPKRAILSVDPGNRYGHPSAEIVVDLMERLGNQNVLLTGADGGVRIGARGVEAVYTAADPDIYPMFFKPRRIIVEGMAKTPERLAEIAALDKLPAMMRGPVAKLEVPVGRALNAALAARVRITGTMFPEEFEAGRVPASGTVRTALGDGHVFKVPLQPAVYVQAVNPLKPEDRDRIWKAYGLHKDIWFQAPSGLPDPYLPPDTLDPDGAPRPPSPTPGTPPVRPLPPDTGKGSAVTIPNGGMVFLDGGRVEVEGARSRLHGANIVECGLLACIDTPDGQRYQLPFADLPMLREILWRVNHGASSFYLSINPRKQLLRADFPIERIPTGVLQSGPGRGGANAVNDVVTAGGIERSRIGDILWRADVAFKSKSLGFDVLTGARWGTDASLLISDELRGTMGANVAEKDRWCRLYWGSGTPKFAFGAGKVTVSGPALRARAEAMLPKDGGLVPFPQGGWCAREKRVASVLERQANIAGGTDTLGLLRRVAQMQSFAIWARRNGIGSAAFALEPAPGKPVPGWTSGIRTPTVTRIKPERRIEPGFRGYVIHVWSSNPKAIACADEAEERMDADFTRLKMPTRDGQWAVGPDSYSKLDTWLTETTSWIKACGSGQIEPVLDNADIEVKKGKAATVDVKPHLLSAQLHGGVLLGASGDERKFVEALGEKGALWSPDGKLLFKRVGDALHFWNALPDGKGSEHIVVTSGEIQKVVARGGLLLFALDAGPQAIVRSDLRLGSDPDGPGLEWMEVRQASDGAILTAKVARPCETAGAAADCVEVVSADRPSALARAAGEQSDDEAEEQSIRATPGEGKTWYVGLDISRFAELLLPAKDAGPDGQLSAAEALGRWGFPLEAMLVLHGTLDSVSPDAEDTILRDSILGED